MQNRKDEGLGSKLSQDFTNNRKLYHKEVRRIRGEQKSDVSRIKYENGRIVKGNKEILDRWRYYFRNLMASSDDRDAQVSCWGMVGGLGRGKEQVGIVRKELKKAVKKLKMGKAPGIDGIRAEMIKYGGEEMMDRLMRVCQTAWETGRVPEEWTMAIIVPLNKGKGCRDLCTNYRGISLLSIPGKVYGTVIIERIKEPTRTIIGEEQGAFLEGRGCIDQIHTVRMIAEKYIGRRKRLYAAFMVLEKAYDTVDRKALWDVLQLFIYLQSFSGNHFGVLCTSHPYHLCVSHKRHNL